ncbi:periplasmic chaperone for outer membrane proteins SurA [Paracoccus halophilus]|uniref:Parvulin-like PPIase n=1 Tax=Paracoccus halophilus TaxID=376733 RepID=A0A099F4Q7_9RHOB|nr:peptidylprolyl isomerase [Paracoccus halophilus]KGJ05122.1 peptidylprolyl isomerase [Paracoccus halophilus]SFA44003.1 periplasmic chaperone for outer membrane proteins SurA [Paracoccus halophilus]
MRRILLGAAMAAILTGTGLAPQAAQAQGSGFQPVVYVNDAAVTGFELDQRVRFLQLLRAPESSPAAAEKALIEDRLRLFAARQFGISATDEQIDAGLVEFAGRANMSVEDFTAALARAGIEQQTFRDFISAGVVWREVVRQRIVGQVRITDAEIDQEMQKIIETPQITHVALSEVIIPAPEGQEDAAMDQAARIVAGTNSEADFAAFARRYSATESAGRGGRLPWMPLANLPPSLRPLVLSLQPGQVSQPLTIPGAVVLFYLRDTRGSLRPGASEQVLDYVRFTLASEAEAARIVGISDSCEDLFVHARELPPQQIERQTLSQGQIPSGEAVRLAVLDDNEATVVSSGAAAQILMLCKRTPALMAEPELPEPAMTEAAATDAEPAPPDPNALPAREEVRNQIFNRKVGQAADAYLAELRANAVIRRP